MLAWSRAEAVRRLVNEAFSGGWIARQFCGKKLECYRSPQRQVLSLVHNTHAPLAEFLEDTVGETVLPIMRKLCVSSQDSEPVSPGLKGVRLSQHSNV